MSTENKDLKDDEAKQAAAAAVEAVEPAEAEQATAAAEEPVAVENESSNSDVEAEAETPSEEQQLADALAEVDALKDRLLRSEAELENVRKRAERESDKARKYALEKFATDLIAVLDSLEMGVDAAQKEGATLEAVREGSELTTKMFMDTLAKHGVKQLDPTGEKFNPEQHEAMVMQPSEEAEPNTVLETFQKGYVLNERVLRAARVVVAKAP